MRYTLPACWAWATSGAAAKPSTMRATAATESRLFIRFPRVDMNQRHLHDRRTKNPARALAKISLHRGRRRSVDSAAGGAFARSDTGVRDGVCLPKM